MPKSKQKEFEASESEIDIQNRIRKDISGEDVITFRNNTGALKDANGRLVQFGLCKGSSDLIGLKSIEITPDMVGKKVGVFVALEVKKPGFDEKKIKPKSREFDQRAFINRVKEMGGIAGFVTDSPQTNQILLDFLDFLSEK